MKLYLSSYFFGDHVDEMLNMVSPKSRVAIIMNAADSSSDEKQSTYYDVESKKFQELGFETEQLDLRNYFDKQDQLEHVLETFGIIWLMGGNSFVLRRALKQSGADLLITNMVTANKLVYAGFSAGSVVAAPTLQGIELVDDPNEIPLGYEPEIVWDGLGLVDYSIAPHYRSDHPESPIIEDVVDYFKSHNMPFKTLRDGEDILVNTPVS